MIPIHLFLLSLSLSFEDEAEDEAEEEEEEEEVVDSLEAKPLVSAAAVGDARGGV